MNLYLKLSELSAVVFCAAFVTCALQRLLENCLISWVAGAIICTALVLVYLIFLHPLLENLFFQGESENTQSDQYRCEDESENTGESP